VLDIAEGAQREALPFRRLLDRQRVVALHRPVDGNVLIDLLGRHLVFVALLPLLLGHYRRAHLDYRPGIRRADQAGEAGRGEGVEDHGAAEGQNERQEGWNEEPAEFHVGSDLPWLRACFRQVEMTFSSYILAREARERKHQGIAKRQSVFNFGRIRGRLFGPSDFHQ